ncbi:HTH_XRE domain containing protein [uncultured Caudovirales phage]|uniref:HTH_XRE domain containing protein n=1 Tax=uncultured Caudovirales phage TaxID=2100421 RepID=A0A6J5SD96_9CAUD|nr:HTH_XRE domain containing protein [uncultured Caudovirales phage]
MLRYKLLLQRELEPSSGSASMKTLRDLARELSMPVPSLHNYVNYDVLPRIDNIQKMAEYFNESISSLYSEDDDTTARLVAKIRNLSATRKKKLLQELK